MKKPIYVSPKERKKTIIFPFVFFAHKEKTPPTAKGKTLMRLLRLPFLWRDVRRMDSWNVFAIRCAAGVFFNLVSFFLRTK